MPVDYNPKDASPVMPAGEYDAELISVEDKTSKAGNAMQKWTMKVYTADGSESVVSEYMVPPKGVYKLNQLAKALGKADAFKAGQFQADDYIGQPFRVALEVQEDAEFGDKNIVKRYLPPANASVLKSAAPAVPAAAPLPNPIRKPATTHKPAASQGDHNAVTEDEIPF